MLAALATRRPRLVIAVHLAVLAVAAVGLARLRESDDLLDFIPPGDPDVKAFNAVNERFGSLRVALVGVEAPAGDDVFAPRVLARIAATTDALKAEHGVDRVVSLTNLVDFAPNADAVQLQPLVDPAMWTDAATQQQRAALRAHVLALDHVAGNFVARDGRSAMIMIFLAAPAPGQHDTTTRALAHRLHDVAQRSLGDLHAIYGGAPFFATTIYDETQTDIRRLSPVAGLFIVAVILLAFREPVAVGLTLAAVAWAVLVVLGLMGLRDEPFTVASSALPVIVFASGASFAVHVLGRYFALGGRAAGKDTIATATRIVTPPVLIAGLTTASGFLSFLVMDIRPMRAFGVECAAGVVLTLVASLVLVPACIALWPRPAPPPSDTGRIGELLAHVGRFGRRYRFVVVVAALAAAAATVKPMLGVQVRMEPRLFFRAGSEPAQAEDFLDEKFGGSQFLQVALAGDMNDPLTLREVARLVDFAAAQQNVTQVQSILTPLTLVSDAMGLGKHLPETRAQVTNLMFFLDGDPSIKALITPNHDGALVHIRLRGDATPALNAVENYVRERFPRVPKAPSRDEIRERLSWIVGRNLAGLFVEQANRPPAPSVPWLIERRRAAASAALGGDDPLVPDGATRNRLVDEIATNGFGDAARAAVLAQARSPEDGKLAVDDLTDRMADVARRAAIDRAVGMVHDGPWTPHPGNDRRRRTIEALLDLMPLHPPVPSTTKMTAIVAGEPVLDRGLSRSVGKNQERSLYVSFVAVFFFMVLLFRSARLAFVSIFPSALTLAVVFGAMGYAGVRIDVGTSLVASIATGAGSDFAMHYLWYLKRSTHEEVVRFVGPVMVISTMLVACGFAVLGMGKAQPMRMFGLLAAISLALAALFTFILVPAMVRLDETDPEKTRR